MANEKAAIPERWEEEYLISCSYQDAAHVLNKRLIEELARAESERDALRAQVEAMSKPVTDEEVVLYTEVTDGRVRAGVYSMRRIVHDTLQGFINRRSASRAKPISAPAADGGAE
jgi:hypothetical protein